MAILFSRKGMVFPISAEMADDTCCKSLFEMFSNTFTTGVFFAFQILPPKESKEELSCQ